MTVAPPSAFAGASVTVEAAFDGNGTFCETAYCRFGAAAVEAHVLRCHARVVPRAFDGEDARSAQPAVSVGIVGDAPGRFPHRGEMISSQVTFSYEAKPSVARVAPRSAPSTGGVFDGDRKHFVDVPSLTCGFSDGGRKHQLGT